VELICFLRGRFGQSVFDERSSSVQSDRGGLTTRTPIAVQAVT
jgi:hypothetical protein